MDIGGRFRRQADACEAMGSPLYASLLRAAAADLDAGGATAVVMDGDDPAPDSAAALRLMGALHRLVLTGRAPALAEHYPSAGGTPGPGAADALLATVREQAGVLREMVRLPVQTNEVGRLPALARGVREVAGSTGRPLRVLEIGASGGLNLSLLDDPSIAERRGCDRRPVDPRTEEGRLTLTSFVWADQLDRLARLRAAFFAAAERPVVVERAHAPEWLDERLAEPAEGAVPVVMHSVVLQYLDEQSRARVEALPAWRVSFEPDQQAGGFALAVVPPGEEPRVLARADGHGANLTWA